MSTPPDQAEGDAPHTIRFPCRVTMQECFAVGWAQKNEVLLARFGYCLKSGHWKVDAAIHRQGVLLQRVGVLPLNAIRRLGACNNGWLDNAGLCKRNHAGWGLGRGLTEGKKTARGRTAREVGRQRGVATCGGRVPPFLQGRYVPKKFENNSS